MTTAPDKMLLKKDLKEKRELINIEVDRFLPRKDEYPKQIHKAMRHTLFAGGKRLRPYLMVHTYKLFCDDLSEKVLMVAGALEMLHTYTLIHDDLPEIDNDDYRRGKKACHVIYGSDIALLAGDALLVNAFQLISETELDDALKVKLIAELAQETGYQGLKEKKLIAKPWSIFITTKQRALSTCRSDLVAISPKPQMPIANACRNMAINWAWRFR
jgi:geranylgeranyl diphosphate synthase type II